jgi:glycine cleavage system H protein
VTEAGYPDDLRYHPEHVWARIEGDVAVCGITWHAQRPLGEVIFLDPPEVGSTVTRGERYAEIESVKAVSDVIAPISGEVVEANLALGQDPTALNRDPYGEGWIARVRLAEPGEPDGLLDRAAYVASLD